MHTYHRACCYYLTFSLCVCLLDTSEHRTRWTLHLYSVRGGKEGSSRAKCPGDPDFIMWHIITLNFTFLMPSSSLKGCRGEKHWHTGWISMQLNFCPLLKREELFSSFLRSLVLWQQQSWPVKFWTGVTSRLKTKNTGAAGRSATRRKWVSRKKKEH